MVELFRQRTDAIDVGPFLGPYQKACSSEYGERLLIPDLPLRGWLRSRILRGRES